MEEQPQLIYDEKATDEQRQAMAEFAAVSSYFSEQELEAALAIVDQYPQITNTLLPLTRNPDKTGALFSAWEAMRNTRAYEVISFSDALEESIMQDERFIKLTKQRPAKDPEIARSSFLRLRFAIWSGQRSVALTASVENEQTA